MQISTSLRLAAAAALLLTYATLTAQNVGVDVATPVEKLDVLGAIRIGTTANTNAGTIRWNSPNFQGYDGTQWINFGGGTLTGSGTATRVAFWSGTNVLSSNANLFWDNTNSRLGIGNSTPDYDLVVGGAIGGIHLVINNIPTARWGLATGGFDLAFQSDISGSFSTKVIFTEDGNVGIGTTSPGARLEVLTNGTAGTGALISQFGSTAAAGRIRFYDEDEGATLGPKIDFNAGNVGQITGGGDIALMPGGNVGIGTTSPTKGKLEVNGSVDQSTLNNYGYLAAGGAGGPAGEASVDISIWASDRIIATEFDANSDARIKNIKGISNSKNDLNTLMNIEITNYNLIDTIEKGNKNYKKVIAQQVEKVYPQVVNTLTDVVPDIYKLAEINDGRIVVANNLKAGEKVKLIFEDRTELVEVVAADKEGFNVNLIDKRKVFVYGREVADFHTVDYEGLTTLNISATQELVKQLNDAQAKIDMLEKENTGVKSDVNTLKAELELIKEHLNMKTEK